MIERKPPDGSVPQQPDEQPKPRHTRLEGIDVIAATTAVAGVLHLVTEVPPSTDETKKPKKNVEHPDWEYTAVGKVVSETCFQSEQSTGTIQNNFVDTFETIFSSPEGTFFYFDTTGNILLTIQQPEALRLLKASTTHKQEYRVQMQTWHNANRKKASRDAVTPSDYETIGYPFVASPQLPGVENASINTSLIQIVRERLLEKTKSVGSGPSYFHSEERSIYDGIVEIAKAYDIPRAIILGIAANESGYDKIAQSPAGARGIFQFTSAGFDDAKQYIEAHKELGASIRTGEIGTYAESWKNRFVSAELFCAYYRVIQVRLKKTMTDLEQRLMQLDPSFPSGTFSDIAAINAYNAGPGRIQKCIERFIHLSDDEIRAHIGEPPYGVDAWLAVTGTSFALTIQGEGSTRVGPDVFMYPQKVLAMGALIMEETNYLSLQDRERNEPDDKVVVFPSRRGLWSGLSKLTGATALVGGLATLAHGRKNPPIDRATTRRDFLRTTAASVGILSPFARLMRDHFPTKENPPIELPSAHHELYEDVLQSATQSLDSLHETLRQNADNGQFGWTADEQDNIREFLAPNNRELLATPIATMLGEDLLKQFEDSEDKPFPKRIPLYDRASAHQAVYIEREKKAGHLVALQENDPTKPYFCEQVGTLSGTRNDPDALFTRPEFEPLLGTLVELVNMQIDVFNKDPGLYGISDSDFPSLPHISAVKISGALRDVESTKHMFEIGQGGRTTPGVSAHWVGSTIDIGSFATAGSHMVRLDGDLLDKKNGVVMVKRGEKLPSQGFGTRTREIFSKMIGRALFAMRESLNEKHGIEIQPLWEATQLNWHIAMHVKE